MSTADNIRALAAEGMATADIARRLGIRYQHAYKVLKRSSTTTTSPAPVPVAGRGSYKPPLSVSELLERGFVRHGVWTIDDAGRLAPGLALPSQVGVYAFAKNGVAQYVGVATMGLAKRIYFYGRPGAAQRTSQRVNGLIRADIEGGALIEIYIALPPDLEWNGLPVHGSAGLELGLIKKYHLPWNMRSAG